MGDGLCLKDLKLQHLTRVLPETRWSRSERLHECPFGWSCNMKHGSTRLLITERVMGGVHVLETEGGSVCAALKTRSEFNSRGESL